MRRPSLCRFRRGAGVGPTAGTQADLADALEERLAAYTLRSAVGDPESLRAAFRPPAPTPPGPAPDTFTTRFPVESLFVQAPAPEAVAEPRPALDAMADPQLEVDRAAATLGVGADASWQEIVRAHRALAWIHHPDRQLGLSRQDQAASEEAMCELNLAYSVLRRRNSRSWWHTEPAMVSRTGDRDR